MNKFIEFAQKNIDSKLLVITFANNAYQLILKNWATQLKNIDVNNYIVITLDKEIEVFCQNNNILSFPLEEIFTTKLENLNDLWLLRTKIFNQLLQNNIDFLHSDIDATWIKDPIERFIDRSDSSIIFSQGTVFPKEALSIWGFVLCCGFFAIKSNKFTKELFQILTKRTETILDDQQALNMLLSTEYEIEWQNEALTPTTKEFMDLPFNCYDEVIKGVFKSYPNESIDLLPHKLFQRLHDPNYEAYVKHCFSHKDLSHKLRMLKDTQCLFIEINEKLLVND